ncbi:MAG: ATP-dependent helicase HrpB, partial [Acidimicrobiales bacterium]|nr:ATP-dependent helicase HrpB [Acidimicrobiales bacterium]
LLATLEAWLVPMVPGLRSAADLRSLDLTAALGARIDHDQRRELDRRAPVSLQLPSGRTARLDYRPDGPRLSTRAQDLYGTTVHPTVDDGAVPVVVELLSPANRPIQVTADLPGFWAGSWAEVRKEMAGRYPKHDWPADPAAPR